MNLLKNKLPLGNGIESPIISRLMEAEQDRKSVEEQAKNIKRGTEKEEKKAVSVTLLASRERLNGICQGQ